MPQQELVAANAVSWSSWVSDFDATYGLFQRSLARLQANATRGFKRPNALTNELSTQMRRGAELHAQMQRLKRQRDIVAGWLNSIGHRIRQIGSATLAWLRNRFGLGACEECVDYLGLAPVYVAVSVAVAAAALAAAARWITETEQLNTRFEAQARLESRGLSPQEASRVVARTAGGGALSSLLEGRVLGIPTIVLVAGGAALLVLPMIMRRR